MRKQWVPQTALEIPSIVPDSGFGSAQKVEMGVGVLVNWISVRPTTSQTGGCYHQLEMTDNRTFGSNSPSSQIAEGYSYWTQPQGGFRTPPSQMVQNNINKTLGVEVNTVLHLSYVHYSGSDRRYLTIVGWSKWE